MMMKVFQAESEPYLCCKDLVSVLWPHSVFSPLTEISNRIDLDRRMPNEAPLNL